MYTLDDTIAAITTPPGRGGIGIVRVAGPRAYAIADTLFRPAHGPAPSQCASHTIHFGRLMDTDTVIDEGLALLMKAPHTYTGQDTVELSLHGGPLVLQQALQLCLRAGARQAGPGEFTYRAYALGKMDLAKAEAVCDLISAKTATAARAAVRVLEGALSSKIQAWRRELIDCLALMEAAIDHSDEDIAFIDPSALSSRLDDLLKGVTQLERSCTKARHLRDGLRAVICGRPNAGKSSLLNALLERDRALVSDIPGTTRDLIEETLDIDGVPVVVTDTAGLRAGTTDPLERAGQERTRAALAAADVVLWVVDASAPFSDEDRRIRQQLAEQQLLPKTIAILNKTDLPPALDTSAPAVPAQISVSCVTGTGIDRLEAQLTQAAADTSHDTSLIMINERHRAALHTAAEALSAARGAAGAATDDIIALHLREALTALGTITGDTADTEILDTIFSRFCIGK